MDKEFFSSEEEKRDELFFTAVDHDRYSAYANDGKTNAIVSGIVISAGVSVSIILSVFSILKGRNSYVPLALLFANVGNAAFFSKSLVDYFKNKKLKDQMLAKFKEIEKIPVAKSSEDEKNND